MTYDLVIRSGRVLDPAESLDGPADVAILNGRISAVGHIEGAACQVVDATGLCVSPRWIDLHAHVAYGVVRHSVHPDADAGVAKGVTTVVDTAPAACTHSRRFRRPSSGGQRREFWRF